VAALGLHADEAARYTQLLTAARAAVDVQLAAAQVRFDANNFAAEGNPVTRRAAIQTALDGVVALGLHADEAARYTQLLTAARAAVDVQLAAAQVRFDANNFAAEANPVTRRAAMQTALDGVAALGLHADEAARYTQLLTAARAAVDVQLAAAQVRFDANNFAADGNPVTRRAAIQTALDGVAALGLHADEAARYTQLLTAARGVAEGLWATSLQTRLADIIARNGNDRAELGALNTLRGDITGAIANVRALLPGGNTTQLLARLDARRDPLAAAIRVEDDLAVVAHGNNQQEVDALAPLLIRAGAITLAAWRDRLVQTMTARRDAVVLHLQQLQAAVAEHPHVTWMRVTNY
jgi:hypothetical protein